MSESETARPMAGKTVVVTGGAGGIGRATADGLARLGAAVVVVGRDRARGEAAVAAIRAGSGNDQVELLLADLSSLADIGRLATELTARHERLDVLINNVGRLSPRREETAEGFEETFATNVLGPFLLTQRLLPLLQSGSRARIVNVSGGMPPGSLDFDNLQGERRYEAFRAYSHSKLANLLWTFELARRLAGSTVSANAANPGLADTAMTRSMVTIMPPLVRPLGAAMRRLGVVVRSPAEAAVSPFRAASDPTLAGVSSRYFEPGGKEGRPLRGATDPVAGQRLWALCEQLVGATGQADGHTLTTRRGV